MLRVGRGRVRCVEMVTLEKVCGGKRKSLQSTSLSAGAGSRVLILTTANGSPVKKEEAFEKANDKA